MTEQELSNLTDEELIVKENKMKSTTILRALTVGLMAGIIIYSAAKNNIGFFTLIPLFFIYKLLSNSKQHKLLEQELQKRNLK
jgi:hypothetical protein